MAKLTRKTQKLFGENSAQDEMTSFGSPTLGTPTFTRDLDIIQSTEFANGWFPTILDGAIRPYAEDMNGMFYLFTYQLKYLFEQGIPEYDAGTKYYTNSICKYGTDLYISLVDDNIGNNPISTTGYWQWYAGINDPNALPIGTIQDYAGTSLTNSKWMFCRGQAVSRTTYAKLFSVIGVTYGAGDGSTTFNLPNLQARFVLGADSAGANSIVGATGGSFNHTHINYGHSHSVGNLSISTPSGGHIHTITDNGHSHTSPQHRHAVPFSDYRVQENKQQGVRETDVTPDGSYSSNSPAYTTKTAVNINPATTGITINSNTHTHPASSFSGNVGKTSGVLGDNDQVTSGSNPPYIVLNKIIKVA
jgi:microcystin-dependent protein